MTKFSALPRPDARVRRSLADKIDAATRQELSSGAKYRLFWICIFYFGSGLPFGLLADALPVQLRQAGVVLTDIGLLATLQLPWSLKPLWAPWVDRYLAPSRWVIFSLLTCAAALGGVAALSDPAGSMVNPALWGALLVLALASATQDVAVDGAFVRFLPSSEHGVGNGLRVSSYRAALIVGGGGSVLVAAALSWRWAWIIAAALHILLALVCAAGPALPRAPTPSWRAWAGSLHDWLRQPGLAGVFAFILLYKLGDAAMAAMVKPFWVDLGMTAAEIGTINTSLGIALTVAGALTGGWFTSRVGVFRSLWLLGLGQAFSNLGYAAVAYWGGGRMGLFAASTIECFTQGLGTAAQMALLTRICDPAQAATQFAGLTAMFGLTRAFAGILSGWGVSTMGYAAYFVFTFWLSLPAYVFLPAVRRLLAGRPTIAVSGPVVID